MKLALFAFPQFPWMSPDVKTEADAKITIMTRITEWTEVEFPARDPAEVIADKIDSIDKQIAQIRDEKDEALARLQKLRATLAIEAELVV